MSNTNSVQISKHIQNSPKLEYSVYLTVYSGNKLPMFYIGYAKTDNIYKKNYRGSVISKTYKDIWKDELKNKPNLFKIIILNYYSSLFDAKQKETYFQKFFKVHKNPMYINKCINGEKFYLDPECKITKKKMSEAKKGFIYYNNGLVNKLCKISPGEEWNKGKLHSKEYIETLKNRMISNNPMKNNKIRKKVSRTLKLKNNKQGSLEYFIQKYGEIEGETRYLTSCERKSIKKLGKNNPMYKNTDASKHLNISNMKCIHCGLISTKGNISRWHNDNCKSIKCS